VCKVFRNSKTPNQSQTLIGTSRLYRDREQRPTTGNLVNENIVDVCLN